MGPEVGFDPMLRFVTVAVPLLLLACVHTREIPTAELARLDGFGNTGISLAGDDESRRYVTLKDVEGEPVAFTKDSKLRLLLKGDGLIDETGGPSLDGRSRSPSCTKRDFRFPFVRSQQIQRARSGTGGSLLCGDACHCDCR